MSPSHATAIVCSVVADAIQIALAPAFVLGAVSPADLVLDLVMFIILLRVFGWSLAILPTCIVELLPIATELPTWTATTLYLISRSKQNRSP